MSTLTERVTRVRLPARGVIQSLVGARPWQCWALGGIAALLSACQASGSPATSSSAAATSPAASKPAASPSVSAPAAAKPATWDQVLEAGRREGMVHILAPPGEDTRQIFIEAFEKANPAIKVEATIGFGGSDIVPRLLAERQTGKFIPDIYLHSGVSAMSSLKPAGALTPLKSEPILPEMANAAGWLGNHLWWTDAAEPMTNLRYEGSLQLWVFYNTKMANPAEFTSYKNLLEPKWIGKILARDLRVSGVGTFPSWFIYRHPEMGPQFLQQLFSNTNLALATDQRQMLDWLAQGRFPIALFLSSKDINAAARQGLPVGQVPAEQFKEGVPLGSGSGSLSLIDRAPHPNAARVYINWLLSKDGQSTYERVSANPSLRVDIPKDTVDPLITPKPGAQYEDSGTETYSKLDGKDLREAVSSIINQSMQK